MTEFDVYSLEVSPGNIYLQFAINKFINKMQNFIVKTFVVGVFIIFFSNLIRRSTVLNQKCQFLQIFRRNQTIRSQSPTSAMKKKTC